MKRFEATKGQRKDVGKIDQTWRLIYTVGGDGLG